MEGLIEISLNFEIGRYWQINSHMGIPYFSKVQSSTLLLCFLHLFFLLLSFEFFPEHKGFSSETSL